MRLLLLLLLAGCANGSAIDITHVHGLAYVPDLDALFVATHHGLVRGQLDGGGWAYIGPDRHDTMGFTQDAVSTTFYMSGHPSDPDAYGGVHLGLLRSLDAGESWHQQSLQGDVDFHALTALPQAGHLVGHWQGSLLVSSDAGASWTAQDAPPGVLALAAGGDRVWAGTTAGLHVADAAMRDWAPVDAALPGAVATLAASRDGATLLVWGQTGVHRSSDGGATWQPVAEAALVNQQPVVFALDPADAQHAFASTRDAHILESRDGGATWRTLRH